MAIKGIDISKYQSNVDYNKVKADGIRFAIIRIGYTGYGRGKKQAKDPLFTTHYNGFKSIGMPLGGYFFGRGTSAEEGQKEANFVLSLIAGKNFEYPIFYDTEDTHYQAKATKAQNTAACKAFCDTIKAAGYKTGVYASKNWFQEHLNDAELSQYDHWCAQYSSKITYKGAYTIWQYSSKGRVNGIKGNVDVNWGYKDYAAEGISTPSIPAPQPTPTPAPVTQNTDTFGTAGDVIRLNKVALYVNSTTGAKNNIISGTYYLWSNKVIKGRIRITNSKANVGKAGQVTGFINISDISNLTPQSSVNTPIFTPTPAPARLGYSKGDKVSVVNATLFVSSTAKSGRRKTGTYYIYDGKKINGRYRVTKKKEWCNKKPVALYVTGWMAL